MDIIHNDDQHHEGQLDDQYSPQPKQKLSSDTYQSLVPYADAKKKRGLAYSDKDDELLCLAWLDTSVDLFHGVEQKGSTFWQRIHDWFHENKHYEPYNKKNSKSKFANPSVVDHSRGHQQVLRCICTNAKPTDFKFWPGIMYGRERARPHSSLRPARAPRRLSVKEACDERYVAVA